MANEEARALFIARARIITEIRRFLDAAGFVEVETPVLQPIYGGAAARPFTTHHNALDRTLYLRIATELYLKRLIVGGLERVYEIGKDFRNEGLSPKHNPEFTMLEWYEAYADYEDVARRTEELVHTVAQALAVSGFEPPWKRETFGGAIRDRTGVDVYAHRDLEALRAALRERDLEVPEHEGTWAKLVDHLLSKYVEPDADRADLPRRLSRRAVAVRQAPPQRAGPRRALRGLRRRHGDRERVHRAQRPRRPARPLRRVRRRRRGRATRRRSPTTSRTSRRSSRACRRPAGSGSASTGS